MKENLNLLIAIRQVGIRQRDFAKLVGVNESIISSVINGRINLRASEKLKYARALKRKPEGIFPE
jgi:predicted XRE-type DNA-binding protein